jgi:SAM-dependent methyltransferase
MDTLTVVSTKLADPEDVAHVREVAIRHHDIMVSEFEHRYEEMARDRFSSAFAYGRHKIDDLLRAELLLLPPGSKVLDVGCGTGPYLSLIEDMGHKAFGVEPARGMRERAATDHLAADVRDGVASALPFFDEQFDLVIAIEVYRYLSAADISAAYEEARRVLRPGGRFFFTMVNRDALDGFWVMQRVRERATAGRISDEHPHCEFVTPTRVEGELRDTGFGDIVTEGRLLAPIRIAYKASPRLGRSIARRIERFDDRVSDTRVMTRFSGHLVCTATKP